MTAWLAVVARMPPSRTAWCLSAGCVALTIGGITGGAAPQERRARNTETRNRRGRGGEHVKGNDNRTVNTRRSSLARRARATSATGRRRDCFPWALRSSIVAQARSLHRRRYRSIAVLSSSFAAPPRDSDLLSLTELTADPHPFFIPYQLRGTRWPGPGALGPLDGDFLAESRPLTCDWNLFIFLLI